MILFCTSWRSKCKLALKLVPFNREITIPESQHLSILGEDSQSILPLHTVFSCGNPNNVNLVNLGSEMFVQSLSSLLLPTNISSIELQFLTINFFKFWSCWTNCGVNNLFIKWHWVIQNSVRKENMPSCDKDCLSTTLSLQTSINLAKEVGDRHGMFHHERDSEKCFS